MWSVCIYKKGTIWFSSLTGILTSNRSTSILHHPQINLKMDTWRKHYKMEISYWPICPIYKYDITWTEILQFLPHFFPLTNYSVNYEKHQTQFRYWKLHFRIWTFLDQNISFDGILVHWPILVSAIIINGTKHDSCSGSKISRESYEKWKMAILISMRPWMTRGTHVNVIVDETRCAFYYLLWHIFARFLEFRRNVFRISEFP